MLDGEPAPIESDLAAICQTFDCTPDVAVKLRSWRWAQTTRSVMDAMHVQRLKHEHNKKDGSKGWTQADHDMWKLVCKLTGRTQQPIQRQPEIGNSG